MTPRSSFPLSPGKLDGASKAERGLFQRCAQPLRVVFTCYQAVLTHSNDELRLASPHEVEQPVRVAFAVHDMDEFELVARPPFHFTDQVQPPFRLHTVRETRRVVGVLALQSDNREHAQQTERLAKSVGRHRQAGVSEKSALVLRCSKAPFAHLDSPELKEGTVVQREHPLSRLRSAHCGLDMTVKDGIPIHAVVADKPVERFQVRVRFKHLGKRSIRLLFEGRNHFDQSLGKSKVRETDTDKVRSGGLRCGCVHGALQVPPDRT